MLRLTLTHLTLIGASVEPATVEFGPQLNLIRGPSDTGKSFIVDAVDFMLGANALKEIPERVGYATVLLGLKLPDGNPVTLARSVTGGNIGLYRDDIRYGPLGVPNETLAAKHNPRTEGNLSRFLLDQIGLDGRQVRKNAQNATDTLSFRNLAHLCVVDETQMQSDVPPAITGNYVSKTKEISVLKLLLQDEDDSALVPVDSKQERSRLRVAKTEVIDRLLLDLQARLSETPGPAELQSQLARLSVSIDEQSHSIAELTSRRNSIAQALSTTQRESVQRRRELGDALALQARFSLLLSQYDSDLARLEMIKEAGNLLGYFRRGVCVFCGADPEHQHLNHSFEDNATSFGESVEVEFLKTNSLREDLISSLADLSGQLEELRAHLGDARIRAAKLQERVRWLDEQIQPQHGDLKELLDMRTVVEKSLDTYEQVENLETLKRQVVDESTTDAAAAAAGLDLAVLREFSAEMARRLSDWGYPDAATVRYDRNEQDVIAGDQLRSAHGKGVRAILHAAFTLGLAQYCFDRDIPHPGFVILDSPLVTYRPPDVGYTVESLDDDGLDDDVVRAFYDDIQERFDGQIIVMENTNPPAPLRAESVDIPFTKVRGSGRFGFFPVHDSGAETEGEAAPDLDLH